MEQIKKFLHGKGFALAVSYTHLTLPTSQNV